MPAQALNRRTIERRGAICFMATFIYKINLERFCDQITE
jgi:hypothetical protein